MGRGATFLVKTVGFSEGGPCFVPILLDGPFHKSARDKEIITEASLLAVLMEDLDRIAKFFLLLTLCPHCVHLCFHKYMAVYLTWFVLPIHVFVNRLVMFSFFL